MNKRNSALVISLLSVLLAVLMIIAANLTREKTRPDQSTSAATTQTTAPGTTAPPETTAPATVPTTVPTTVPEVTAPAISPDTVGIYIPAADGSKARVLLTEFSAPRTAKKDIDCFEVFASNVTRLEGSSFSAIWTDTWNAHEDAQNAKIGFHISFTLTDGTQVDQTVRKPSDAKAFYEYLEVYLYDDIHTGGGWYTHLEDSNIGEQTVITSIKLTSGSKIAEVGDICLTAFIYNGEACFDASGNYIGDVLQTILITE